MMDTRQIVRRALITEKGSVLRELANQVTFEVHPDANKIEIKRLGRSAGRRPDWKRAIVTLAKDQTIEMFDQV